MKQKNELRNRFNIIEAKSMEEANQIDNKIYRFERYSETRDCYIFVKRSKILSE